MIIDILRNHMAEIPEDAYSMSNPDILESPYSTKESFPENNFVSEIKMLLCLHTDYRDNNFQVHTDKYKRINGRIIDPNLQNQFSDMNIENGIRPDLIIHRAQDNTNPENQIFSMECKIDPSLNYTKFKKDLFKLMLYKEVLNYSENLYLIANMKSNTVYRFLDKYREEGMFFSATGINILNIESFGGIPETIY